MQKKKGNKIKIVTKKICVYIIIGMLSARLAYAQLNYSIQLTGLSGGPLESKIFETLYPKKEFKDKLGFGWEFCFQTNYKIGNKVHIGLGIGTGIINLQSSKITFNNYGNTSSVDEVLNWKEFQTSNIFLTPVLLFEMDSDKMIYVSTGFNRIFSYTEVDRTNVNNTSSSQNTLLLVKEKNRPEINIQKFFYSFNMGYQKRLNEIYLVDFGISLLPLQLNQRMNYLLLPSLGCSYLIKY